LELWKWKLRTLFNYQVKNPLKNYHYLNNFGFNFLSTCVWSTEIQFGSLFRLQREIWDSSPPGEKNITLPVSHSVLGVELGWDWEKLSLVSFCTVSCHMMLLCTKYFCFMHIFPKTFGYSFHTPRNSKQLNQNWEKSGIFAWDIFIPRIWWSIWRNQTWFILPRVRTNFLSIQSRIFQKTCTILKWPNWGRIF
jgi:hypothetical protein